MFEAYCKRNMIVYFIIMLFLSKHTMLLYVSVTHNIFCKSSWRSCSLHVSVRSYNLKVKFLIADIQNTKQCILL